MRLRKHKRGKKINELAVLTGSVALLVLIGLAISPGGGAIIGRALTLSNTAPESQTARVTVLVRMTANPTSLSEGQSTTLSWWSYQADVCQLGGTGVIPNWGSARLVPTNGSYTTTPLSEGNYNYALYCYNSGYWNQGSAWSSASVSVGPPPGQPCQSAPNICGQRGDGTSIRGVCDAVTPPDSSCPACTSPANGCGMTNSGIVINGVCNAGTPSNSSCPACTSPANGCGMTNSGNVINGSCNVSTPSNSLCPACTSAPNACGQTNTGNVLGGVCSATTPTNASCPPPTMGTGSFTVQPSTIGVGTTGILRWTVTNATVCHITSNSSFSALNQAISGSVSTGPILAATTYTLTCQNGTGGPQNTKSIKVIVDPHFKEV